MTYQSKNVAKPAVDQNNNPVQAPFINITMPELSYTLLPEGITY
ncbi:hypothetical protein [Anaeromicropila populeti]|nr:hypothetical protein [Anaeromicropila populeti]